MPGQDLCVGRGPAWGNLAGCRSGWEGSALVPVVQDLGCFGCGSRGVVVLLGGVPGRSLCVKGWACP